MNWIDAGPVEAVRDGGAANINASWLDWTDWEAAPMPALICPIGDATAAMLLLAVAL